jgi:16S rRNA (adenine1518-N6/adenine1519-N6)-dimethyltransferase
MTSNSPKQLLSEWKLRAKHHFGQNFISNPELSEKIAERAVQGQGGTVVEIGAGLGALTAPLLTRAKKVVAIERDRDLVPFLQGKFEQSISDGRLVVLEEDAKATDYLRQFAIGPTPYILAGNLPYQITGPLLRRAVELASVIERAVLMVQLEVADRLCASPGSRSYGALSVFVQACFSVQRISVVKRGAFYPQPNVDSAIIELTPLHPFVSEESPLFREIVQLAFRYRRKILRNAWSGLTLAAASDLQSAAARSGIDLDARGETLSVHHFARLAKELAS